MNTFGIQSCIPKNAQKHHKKDITFMGHPVVANVVVNIFDVFPLLRQSPMGMYENLEIIRDKGDCVQRKSQKSVLERCMKMYQKKKI